ncbi:hypothetical protein ACSNOK_01975 [Streptomyces sp. URMC 126]
MVGRRMPGAAGGAAVVAVAVAAGVWVAVPRPVPGAGTVDIEKLTAL